MRILARVAVVLAAPLAVASPSAQPVLAAPIERRLHSDNIDASSFLWNDGNKFVENFPVSMAPLAELPVTTCRAAAALGCR